jgi:carboxyl-terminal processing protease
LGASFWLGTLYGYAHRPAAERVLGVTSQKTPEHLKDVDFSLFWEAWANLEEKYVDRAKIDRQKMVYGAISGLAQSLKDPYTQFFPPAESKQFQEDIKGSFGGIGAEIGIRKGVLTVIAPLKDNPAERAGIRAADSIVKINDTPTADLTLEEAVRMIRGEVGTNVRLMIFREGMSKPKEYIITRAVIKVVVLTTEKRPNGVFVIKLNEFTENAASEFRKAMQEFADSRSQKLVLDLRNNPGGYLTVAVDIASWFAPAGEVIAREHYADGKEDVYRSGGYRLLERVPTVVLVNEGSASASEIVAGALRDLRGIKLVGAKTFGKGSVQEVVDMSRQSSMKITIAKWLTPNGTEINGKGLEPDIKVEISETPPKDAEGKDPVMEKGIETLNAQMAR